MFEKSVGHSHSSPVLLFASPPQFNELCAVTVLVSTFTQSNPTASKFQPQIIKCREIIFTEPDVIGTPAYDIDNCFHLIMQQSLYTSGRLQARFLKQGLEAKKPVRVTAAIYQSCLRYTLLARIAPQWNKAGQWLIQGRDFLTHCGYADAVKLDLMVNTEELFFSLEAATIRFPCLEIADLDICSTSLCAFLSNEKATVKHHSIGLSWCHVLPSMKKGKVMSISHEIPEDCPFKSYKDIKRHWKNTYGYRLPEAEDHILYYQVHFKPLGNTYYTYPDVCLRARDIQKVPRVDPKPILMTFLKDLHGKLPKICGMPLKLQPKATYPTVGLKECDLMENRENINLATKNPSVRKVVYRSRQEMQHLYNKQSAAASSNKEVAPSSMDLQHFRIADSYASNSEQKRNSFISNANLPVNIKHLSERCQFQQNGPRTAKNENDTEVIPSSQQPRSQFVPFFKAKKRDIIVHSKPEAVHSSKVTPSFSAKKNLSTMETDTVSVQRQCTHQDRANNAVSVSDRNIQYQISDFAFQTPASMGMFRNTVNHSTVKPVFEQRQTGHQFAPGTPKINSNSSLPRTPTGQPVFLCSNSSTPTTPQLKRKTMKPSDGEPTPKKSRSKPQVQENVDVDHLARSRQLNKVNTVTLIAWLKDRGVICKSKDKKTDIVEKVIGFLKVTDHEQ